MSDEPILTDSEQGRIGQRAPYETVVPPDLQAQWAVQDAFEYLEGAENHIREAREALKKLHGWWAIRYAELLADHGRSVAVADRLIGEDRDLREVLTRIRDKSTYTEDEGYRISEREMAYVRQVLGAMGSR